MIRKLKTIVLFAALLCLSLPAFASTPCLTNKPCPLKIQTANGSYALEGNKYAGARVLAANTAETITLPTGTDVKEYWVFFSANCAEFWLDARGLTAAVPAADITNGTAPILNPTVRRYESTVTSLSVIAPTTCTVGYEVFF